MTSKKIVIFDVDGTLSDCRHRQHFLEGSDKDWKSFFEHAEHDKPIPELIELIQTLYASGRYEIILCTGRGEEMRGLTEKWLRQHDVPHHSLMMRKVRDRRQDSIVKKEMLEAIGAQRVLFAVDDRQQVVNMWRQNGVRCLQCDEGDF